MWLLLPGVLGRGGDSNVQSFPEGMGREHRATALGFFPAQADKMGKSGALEKGVLQIFALSLKGARFPGGEPQLWFCKRHK